MDYLKYFEIVPLFVSAAAISVVIVLFILKAKKEKEFKQKVKEDQETISTLLQDKHTLQELILQRLEALFKEEKEMRHMIKDVVENRVKREEDQRKEDFMNWLEYRAKKWQDQIEERFLQRFSLMQKEMNEINHRVTKLEKHILKKESL